MTGIKYIAEKMNEYSDRETPIEITPRRMRELRSSLRSLQQIIQTNSESSDEYGYKIFSPSRSDVESTGEMEFLLNRFFPGGNVPEILQKYAQFVQGVRY